MLHGSLHRNVSGEKQLCSMTTLKEEDKPLSKLVTPCPYPARKQREREISGVGIPVSSEFAFRHLLVR